VVGGGEMVGIGEEEQNEGIDGRGQGEMGVAVQLDLGRG